MTITGITIYFITDIPGATLDDALSMMDDLIPHLISENGAVFTDVHDGNWYVRGNMRRWVENGGPMMIFQNTSFGVQGSIVRVISNAYGVKEVLLDGEPMEYGERGYSAPQVNTTAESEHQVTFVMCSDFLYAACARVQLFQRTVDRVYPDTR